MKPGSVDEDTLIFKKSRTDVAEIQSCGWRQRFGDLLSGGSQGLYTSACNGLPVVTAASGLNLRDGYHWAASQQLEFNSTVQNVSPPHINIHPQQIFGNQPDEQTRTIQRGSQSSSSTEYSHVPTVTLNVRITNPELQRSRNDSHIAREVTKTDYHASHQSNEVGRTRHTSSVNTSPRGQSAAVARKHRPDNRFMQMKLDREALIKGCKSFIEFFNLNSNSFLKNAREKEIMPEKRAETASALDHRSHDVSRFHYKNPYNADEMCIEGFSGNRQTSDKATVKRKSISSDSSSDFSLDRFDGHAKRRRLDENVAVDANEAITSSHKTGSLYNSRRSFEQHRENPVMETAHNSIRRTSENIRRSFPENRENSHHKVAQVEHIESYEPECSRHYSDPYIKQRCRSYMRKKSCLKGTSCTYLHKWPKDDNILCSKYEKGSCEKSGDECWYKHAKATISEENRSGRSIDGDSHPVELYPETAENSSSEKITQGGNRTFCSPAGDEVRCQEKTDKGSGKKFCVVSARSDGPQNKEIFTGKKFSEQNCRSVREEGSSVVDKLSEARSKEPFSDRTSSRQKSHEIIHQQHNEDRTSSRRKSHEIIPRQRNEDEFNFSKSEVEHCNNHHKERDAQETEQNDSSVPADIGDSSLRNRCRRYLRVRSCRKGEDCKFLHTLPKDDGILCEKFRIGCCSKSQEECWFKHESDVSSVNKNINVTDVPVGKETEPGCHLSLRAISLGNMLTSLRSKQKSDASETEDKQNSKCTLKFTPSVENSKKSVVTVPVKRESQSNVLGIAKEIASFSSSSKDPMIASPKSQSCDKKAVALQNVKKSDKQTAFKIGRKNSHADVQPLNKSSGSLQSASVCSDTRSAQKDRLKHQRSDTSSALLNTNDVSQDSSEFDSKAAESVDVLKDRSKKERRQSGKQSKQSKKQKESISSKSKGNSPVKSKNVESKRKKSLTSVEKRHSHLFGQNKDRESKRVDSNDSPTVKKHVTDSEKKRKKFEKLFCVNKSSKDKVKDKKSLGNKRDKSKDDITDIGSKSKEHLLKQKDITRGSIDGRCKMQGEERKGKGNLDSKSHRKEAEEASRIKEKIKDVYKIIPSKSTENQITPKIIIKRVPCNVKSTKKTKSSSLLFNARRRIIYSSEEDEDQSDCQSVMNSSEDDDDERECTGDIDEVSESVSGGGEVFTSEDAERKRRKSSLKKLLLPKGKVEKHSKTPKESCAAIRSTEHASHSYDCNGTTSCAGITDHKKRKISEKLNHKVKKVRKNDIKDASSSDQQQVGVKETESLAEENTDTPHASVGPSTESDSVKREQDAVPFATVVCASASESNEESEVLVAEEDSRGRRSDSEKDLQDMNSKLIDDGYGFPVRSLTPRAELKEIMARATLYEGDSQKEENFNVIHSEFIEVYKIFVDHEILESSGSDPDVVLEANLRILIPSISERLDVAFKVRENLLEHWRQEPSLRSFKNKYLG